MDENKILKVKELLYNVDNDEVKRVILQTGDQEILYVYAYNYNWDNGFDIPQTVLDNEKCDLSTALLIFYRADGLSYLQDKSDNINLPQWSIFIKKLYNSILRGKYQRGKIEFKIPLSKVQLYKLRKEVTVEENVFTQNIDGKCLDINL
ncbi:MAG: DUF4274 domain-containing protein [Lachnospiraceae bacterium]|nr:DUF4274 domain-containing protein [Lachnospiraceae bacterium]